MHSTYAFAYTHRTPVAVSVCDLRGCAGSSARTHKHAVCSARTSRSLYLAVPAQISTQIPSLYTQTPNLPGCVSVVCASLARYRGKRVICQYFRISRLTHTHTIHPFVDIFYIPIAIVGFTRTWSAASVARTHASRVNDQISPNSRPP